LIQVSFLKLRGKLMSTSQQLNQQFGLKGQLTFRDDASGLILAEINNSAAVATLCLQGAHLMSWRPKNQAVPVVWLSRDAKLTKGKSIRGGAPVCWPWFGAHPSRNDFPGHGFARTVSWQVIGSGNEDDDATRLTLQLVGNDDTQAQWPYSSTVQLNVIVGQALRMELVTENHGTADFEIGEALHTYLQIGDIASVSVSGLQGCEFWDKVGGAVLRKQAEEITFAGETDRVYINTASECVIEDDKLQRRIHVNKTGSLSTVVWTPWLEKANKMGDMGQPEGWREMLCVESANALDNVVTVPAGSKHALIVEYRAESM